MIRRALAAGALAALLGSCATPATSPAASDPASTSDPPSAGAGTSSPGTAPAETPTAATPAAIELPAPGRPFDSAALLAAMRDSRRPGGVAAEIETDAVAAALASTIWTLDGTPWPSVSAGGSCGPATCTLELAGANAEAAGEDLWVFEVTPGTGAVRVVSADLRALPPDLVARLDELTRALLPPTALEGLNLTSARWLPPPDGTRFVLSYRSGAEEGGSCGIDVTVDAVAPGIVSDVTLDC